MAVTIKSEREIALMRESCKILADVAVLLEDAGYSDPNLIYLAKLPVFKH